MISSDAVHHILSFAQLDFLTDVFSLMSVCREFLFAVPRLVRTFDLSVGRPTFRQLVRCALLFPNVTSIHCDNDLDEIQHAVLRAFVRCAPCCHVNTITDYQNSWPEKDIIGIAIRFPCLSSLTLQVPVEMDFSILFGDAQFFSHLTQFSVVLREDGTAQFWAALDSLPVNALSRSPITHLGIITAGNMDVTGATIAVLNKFTSLRALTLSAHGVRWNVEDEFCSNRNLGIIDMESDLAHDVAFLKFAVVHWPLVPLFRLHADFVLSKMSDMTLSALGAARCALRQSLGNTALANTGQFFVGWADGTVHVFGCE